MAWMLRGTLVAALLGSLGCNSEDPAGGEAEDGGRADAGTADSGTAPDPDGGTAGEDSGVEADLRLELWDVHDFVVEEVEAGGNPFDEVASATFTHEGSGRRVTTEAFYAGEQTHVFRFAATDLGLWTYVTEGAAGALDGLSGTVEVVASTDADRRGFIVSAGSRWARQRTGSDDLEAYIPHVYMNFREWGSMDECGWTPASTFAAEEDVTAYLDEAEANGMNAIFALIATDWQDGADPRLETFEHLERAVRMAHERGMHVHIWAWGDAARGWVPNGGVNGDADRRLQRYIAARLGPMPGWTMSYGFDLHEWVTPEEVESWRDYLVDHMGWDHLLMAREESSFTPVGLDVSATDARLDSAFYDGAADVLADGRPVIFERRFTYLRDGVWSMDTTREARWAFAMAGGAGAIWGHYPPGCTAHEDGTYPSPEQLVIQRRFFDRFLRVDLEPAPATTSAGHALAGPGGHVLVYAEDVDSLTLDLSALDADQPVIAVDALADSFEETSLPDLSPGPSVTVELPHTSDWALAIGSF